MTSAEQLAILSMPASYGTKTIRALFQCNIVLCVIGKCWKHIVPWLS